LHDSILVEALVEVLAQAEAVGVAGQLAAGALSTSERMMPRAGSSLAVK